MKRIYAVGILLALAVALVCLVPRGGALTGSWEATVDLGGEAAPGQSVVLHYTFCDDGTYTCAVAPDRARLTDGVQIQGNYLVRGEKLYMSEGQDYRIDPKVYDLYHLEGDELTLLENSAADMSGFYPLTLTRVAEG